MLGSVLPFRGRRKSWHIHVYRLEPGERFQVAHSRTEEGMVEDEHFHFVWTALFTLNRRQEDPQTDAPFPGIPIRADSEDAVLELVELVLRLDEVSVTTRNRELKARVAGLVSECFSDE